MTPAARVSAAIEILDTVLSGQPAEKTLTTWARRNRFAGSGDRAAIRDLVFDALRCMRSYGYLGGAQTGRAIMIGALRRAGQEVDAVFDGARFAPAPLDEAERQLPVLAQAPDAVQLDQPDWLVAEFRSSLAGRADDVMRALQSRAPVFLRANLAKTDRETAQDELNKDGIETKPHSLSDTALLVTANPRRIQSSRAYLAGLVELQDAASQAVVDSLPIQNGMRVLDYCAGGGGKSLAIAARHTAQVFAHDIDPARMTDIPARATRAGAQITRLQTDALARKAPYDLILIDAPCSGSGAWRRSPEAKWRLTPTKLHEINQLQASILDEASQLLAPDGILAYATCSLFASENAAQISSFVHRHSQWTLLYDRQFTPLDGGDGFYIAHLKP